MHEKNSCEPSVEITKRGSELERGQVLFYSKIAKSNLRKAVLLVFAGLVMIGLGLTFPAWLIGAARYGLAKPIEPALLTTSSSWLVVFPLILIGGYIAYKSFLLLLESVYQVRRVGSLLARQPTDVSEVKQVRL